MGGTSSQSTNSVLWTSPGRPGMRGARFLILVALLFAGTGPHAQAGSESNPEVQDPQGDVTEDFTALSSGALARVLDVTAQWVHQDPDGNFWASTKVASLAEVEQLTETADFSASYALAVQAGLANGKSYQVHASIGGTRYGNPPEWRCSVLNRGTDEWKETMGYIDLDRGVMHVRLTDDAAQALRDAGGRGSLSGQAWGSTTESGRPQSSDWTAGTVPYVLAADQPAPAPNAGLTPCGLTPARAAPAQAGFEDLGDVQLPDPADDVVRGDGSKEPVHDDLARSMDLLAVSYTRDPDGGYWGHIRIADLRPVPSLAAEDFYSAQYASTLVLGDAPANGRNGYEIRASVGGSHYSRPAGSWTCGGHDQATGKWPATSGLVDIERGVLHIKLAPEPAERLDAGLNAHSLDGTAWATTTQAGPQTNDWTRSRVTFKGSDLPVSPAPSGPGLQPCGEDADDAASDGPSPPARPAPPAPYSASWWQPAKDGAQEGPATTASPAGERTTPAVAGTVLAVLLLALACRRR